MGPAARAQMAKGWGTELLPETHVFLFMTLNTVFLLAILVREVPEKNQLGFADIMGQRPSECMQEHRYCSHFVLVICIEQE
jgi:hypothetical protein